MRLEAKVTTQTVRDAELGIEVLPETGVYQTPRHATQGVVQRVVEVVGSIYGANQTGNLTQTG